MIVKLHLYDQLTIYWHIEDYETIFQNVLHYCFLSYSVSLVEMITMVTKEIKKYYLKVFISRFVTQHE